MLPSTVFKIARRNYAVNTESAIFVGKSNYPVLTPCLAYAIVPAMAKQRQKLFSIRTDNDEGEEFLAALDRLRSAERPQLDRTAMVKRLVFEADKKRRAK